MRRSRFTSTRRSIEPRQLLLCDCLIKSSCSLFLSIHLSHSITSYCCFLYGLPLLEASSYLFDFLLKYSLRNPQSLCLTRSYLEHQWTLQSTEVVCRLCGSRSHKIRFFWRQWMNTPKITWRPEIFNPGSWSEPQRQHKVCLAREARFSGEWNWYKWKMHI